MFTKKELIKSRSFNDWVNGAIVLIHNTYYDSKSVSPTWIVVHKNQNQKYTVTRFFKLNNKIQTSEDYFNINDSELLKVLMSEYSRGLK